MPAFVLGVAFGLRSTIPTVSPQFSLWDLPEVSARVPNFVRSGPALDSFSRGMNSESGLVFLAPRGITATTYARTEAYVDQPVSYWRSGQQTKGPRIREGPPCPSSVDLCASSGGESVSAAPPSR
jgi:hypothetical protein